MPLQMIRDISIAVVLVTAVATGSASSSDSDRVSEAADSDWRVPVPERIDEVFSEWDRPGSPGCALGVARSGEILYERGYGTADLDHDVPITASTVFDVGSVSKQFTAAALVLLAERRELSLDDDIREYLPEIPDYGEPITIRQLIHHTSGMRDYLDVMSIVGWPYEDLITDQDIVRIVARQAELNFRPGEEYEYSNSGYMMLGVIVRRVTGDSLGEFAAREIFAPLGMKSSLFYEDRTVIIPNRATGYARDDDGGFRQVHNYNFAVAGDGQLYTTVGDLLLWNHEFEKRRTGEAGFETVMLTRGTLDNGESIDYAFGLAHGTRFGHSTVSHTGSSWGFRAYLVRYPEHGLSLAVLCNVDQASPYELGGKVAQLFLAGNDPGSKLGESEVEESPEPGATPEELAGVEIELAVYEGTYTCEELQATHVVVAKNGRLVIRVQTKRGEWPRYEFEPASDSTFSGDGFELVFNRGADGKIRGFTLGTERARNFWFSRR